MALGGGHLVKNVCYCTHIMVSLLKGDLGRDSRVRV